jgi:uncharacterized protein (DUF1786 family)
VEAHVRAGLAAYATPEAALTFDDELDRVEAMGVKLVSEDEVRGIDGEHVVLRDLDLDGIARALSAFDVGPDWDAIAVGCLDHGNAPPGVSDRLFRFEHLRSVVVEENDLRAFAYIPADIPEYLTRARTIARSLPSGVPAVFLDTGPAAALGALEDPLVRSQETQIILNLGNMHALAFHLCGEQVLALYEHHTGEMEQSQIVDFTRRLAQGTLEHEEVFGSKGHGVIYAEPNRPPTAAGADRSGVGGPGPFVAVTGPQRERVRGSALWPYMAAPHGDMMISGCFGMIRGLAYRWPELRGEVERALG